MTDVTACGRGQYVSLRIFSLSPACLSDNACAAKTAQGPVISFAEFLGRLASLAEFLGRLASLPVPIRWLHYAHYPVSTYPALSVFLEKLVTPRIIRLKSGQGR